jgi:hypothetical protein
VDPHKTLWRSCAEDRLLAVNAFNNRILQESVFPARANRLQIEETNSSGQCNHMKVVHHVSNHSETDGVVRHFRFTPTTKTGLELVRDSKQFIVIEGTLALLFSPWPHFFLLLANRS